MRRRATLLIVSAVALLAAIAAALRACSYVEQPARHYTTYAVAKASDALGPRGWIPAWLPESAYDIHDQHAIDSTSRCIRFSLPEGEAQHLRRLLQPLEPHEVASLDASCRFGATWWFDGLIQQQPANDNALNADLFRGTDESREPIFVAIDRVSPQVFVWSR